MVTTEAQTGIDAEIEKLHRALLARGYRDIDEANGLTIGARVRHGGEQYSEALRRGTGVVRVLVEKDPSAWSREWGRRDIELLVQRDNAPFGSHIGQWADYHTALVTTCYWCNGPVDAAGACECPPEQQARAWRR